MPARPLTDFLAGFFYGRKREDVEADMATTKQGDERKNSTKSIKIEKGKDRDQTILIQHGVTPRKNGISVWSRYEEFAAEWSRTL
jgi:hypothetical protein